MLELVDMEIREILSKYEYDGDNAHIIQGSALAATNDVDPELGEKSVTKLLEIMDTTIPLPERPINKPFMMSVDSTFTIPGRGTVVAGTIEQGKAKIGEEIEIVGYKPTNTKSIITGVETFNKQLDTAEAGDNVGLLLRGLNRDDI